MYLEMIKRNYETNERKKRRGVFSWKVPVKGVLETGKKVKKIYAYLHQCWEEGYRPKGRGSQRRRTLHRFLHSGKNIKSRS